MDLKLTFLEVIILGESISSAIPIVFVAYKHD